MIGNSGGTRWGSVLSASALRNAPPPAFVATMPLDELLADKDQFIGHGLDRELTAYERDYRAESFVKLLHEREVLEAKPRSFHGYLQLAVGRCRCGQPERHPWSLAMRKMSAEQADALGISKSCPIADWHDLGLVSILLVTDDGVDFIVDAFQNTVELEILKYHGIGTGTTAANQADSALETEITTQYNPDSTRATGSTTEGGSTNVYRTVGTNTVDASVAATEHGILSQAATGGGTLLDRHTFTVINLASGDSLQSTYDLTVTAGG